MVKTATTPPEEDEASGILISDLSNPIWGELRRLLEDQEQAAIVLDILVQAITSRAIEEDLPEASRAEHVGRNRERPRDQRGSPSSSGTS